MKTCLVLDKHIVYYMPRWDHPSKWFQLAPKASLWVLRRITPTSDSSE